MPTYDRTKGGTAGYPAHLKGIGYRVTAVVDFSKDNYAAADILQLINVPAKTRVLSVAYNVDVVEGAVQTFDLGDGADPDGYADGFDGNDLAGGGDSDEIVAGFPAPGKYYAAADTIDLIPVNAADAAKITVVAYMRDCSSNE